MHGKAELVEQRLLDWADRLLDTNADEIGGRNVLRAHGARLAVNVGAVIEKWRLALPMAKEGERCLAA